MEFARELDTIIQFGNSQARCRAAPKKCPDIHKASNILMVYSCSHFDIYWKYLGDSLKHFVNQKNNSLKKENEVTNLRISIIHAKYKMK